MKNFFFTLVIAFLLCETTVVAEHIEFRNHCHYSVNVGESWNPPFVSIRTGGGHIHELGNDNKVFPHLAFYGYRWDHDPGLGNRTLAEFTIEKNNLGYYDVSIVDAFSVPMSIHAHSINNQACPVAACQADLLRMCPAQFQIKVKGIVASCSKKGDKSNPNHPVAKLVEHYCPEAYAYDRDSTNTKGCSHANDYTVTFCP